MGIYHKCKSFVEEPTTQYEEIHKPGDTRYEELPPVVEVEFDMPFLPTEERSSCEESDTEITDEMESAAGRVWRRKLQAEMDQISIDFQDITAGLETQDVCNSVITEDVCNTEPLPATLAGPFRPLGQDLLKLTRKMTKIGKLKHPNQIWKFFLYCVCLVIVLIIVGVTLGDTRYEELPPVVEVEFDMPFLPTEERSSCEESDTEITDEMESAAGRVWRRKLQAEMDQISIDFQDITAGLETQDVCNSVITEDVCNTEPLPATLAGPFRPLGQIWKFFLCCVCLVIVLIIVGVTLGVLQPWK
ncbi:uncharacterized protein [Amphiura filiformis]|uniref:uncharacterized protein n=1 Tax=Amphiura filiformis TaxID=82378 RepID=UPI003B214909